jgi:hypothetical protein
MYVCNGKTIDTIIAVSMRQTLKVELSIIALSKHSYKLDT